MTDKTTESTDRDTSDTKQHDKSASGTYPNGESIRDLKWAADTIGNVRCSAHSDLGPKDDEALEVVENWLRERYEDTGGDVDG